MGILPSSVASIDAMAMKKRSHQVRLCSRYIETNEFGNRPLFRLGWVMFLICLKVACT